MLRVESAHIDADGRPIISRVEDYPDMMHEKAYSNAPSIAIPHCVLTISPLGFLKNWIENSLDLYKAIASQLEYGMFNC